MEVLTEKPHYLDIDELKIPKTSGDIPVHSTALPQRSEEKAGGKRRIKEGAGWWEK